MESGNSRVSNVENTNKRWCSLCQELIISENGTLVRGTTIQEHECFRDAEAVRISGHLIFKATHEEQSSAQHPVLQDAATNLGIQKSLAHPVSLVPLTAKKLQGSFGNKFQNVPQGSIITQHANNNNVDYYLPNITQLQGVSNNGLLRLSQSNMNGLMRGSTFSGTTESLAGRDMPVMLNGNRGNIFPHFINFQSSLSEIPQSPLSTPSNVLGTPNKSVESVAPQVAGQEDHHASPAAVSNKEDDNEFDDDEAGSSHTDDDPPSNTFKWTEPMIKLLLDCYNKYKKRYSVKLHLYRRILKDMKEYEYNSVTVKRIENKIKGLEKNYKDKIDNRGPRHSGEDRLKIPFEDEVLEAFGKKPAINPNHLIGATFEYSREDDSVPVEDVDGEMKALCDDANKKKKKKKKSSKEHSEEESCDEKKNEPCKKQRKYVVNVTASENSVKQKYQDEILKRKDQYIELKNRELTLKEENKKKELAIKEQSKKEFFEIQRLKLVLEAKKLKAQYPEVDFDLPQ